jgi:2-phosphosulfolactate phosphatase
LGRSFLTIVELSGDHLRLQARFFKKEALMDIHHTTLENYSVVTEAVVVVDVWRSFTTSAYVFAAGAQDVLVVETLEEAYALKERMAGSLLIGMGVSVVGPPEKGFDFGNSPTEIRDQELLNRQIIQCTPNGTKGLVRSQAAKMLLAGSFVCARATVQHIRQQAPSKVTFLSTESGSGEDQLCGAYMAALLQGEELDITAGMQGIREIGWERTDKYLGQGLITKAQGMQLMAELELCLTLDRFDFAMPVQRQDEYLVMKPEKR